MKEFTPVETVIGDLPEYQQKWKHTHLHAWLVNNKPSDNMIYKDGYWRQGMFVRDDLMSLLEHDSEGGVTVDLMQVISTHTSKSIKLPVYHIKLSNGAEFVIRDNFHGWKVTVMSPIPLDLPKLLFTCGYSEPIDSCYCEGFDKSWVLGPYMSDKSRFTMELYDSKYVFALFLTCLVQYQNVLHKAE